MQKGVAEFRKLFQAESDEIMRDATTRVSNSLVRLSPVLTGEYLAEWDSAKGSWPTDTHPPGDPKRTQTRSRLQAGFKEVRFGDAVFFENTDPVAIAIEYGYSWDKAPQGVVRLTVRRWRGFVRGAGKAAQNRVKKRMVDE